MLPRCSPESATVEWLSAVTVFVRPLVGVRMGAFACDIILARMARHVPVYVRVDVHVCLASSGYVFQAKRFFF